MAAMPPCCFTSAPVPKRTATSSTSHQWEERVLYAAIKKRIAAQPDGYAKNLAAIKGVTEETTTGVQPPYQMHSEAN